MKQSDPRGDRLASGLFYKAPGAGSVALACAHDVRYPDICSTCTEEAKARWQKLISTILDAEDIVIPVTFDPDTVTETSFPYVEGPKTETESS